MECTMAIHETVHTLKEIIARYKSELRTAIDGVREQNPNIKIISESPKCFVMRTGGLSSDLVLDPLYYDFESQFDEFEAKLEKQSLETFERTVKETIRTGKLDGRRIHPEVLQKMQQLIGE